MAWRTSPGRFSSVGGRAKSRNVWIERSRRAVSASRTARSRSVSRRRQGRRLLRQGRLGFHAVLLLRSCGFLDEDFHGRQRIAQLVRQAGGKVPQGGHLLGAKHLQLALLQAVHDRADVVGHPVQEDVQVLDSRGRDDVDRADHFFEPSAGDPNGHIEFHDGAGHAAGDADAGNQSRRRPADRQQPKDHGDPARHAQVVIAALVVQLFLPGEQLLGRRQHAAHGQIAVQPLEARRVSLIERGLGQVPRLGQEPSEIRRGCGRPARFLRHRPPIFPSREASARSARTWRERLRDATGRRSPGTRPIPSALQ